MPKVALIDHPSVPLGVAARLSRASREWNFRFVAYAHDHARSPEAQREYDRQRWPLAPMLGFIEWGRLRLAEFRRLNPDAFHFDSPNSGGLVDHEAYDVWLAYRAAGMRSTIAYPSSGAFGAYIPFALAARLLYAEANAGRDLPPEVRAYACESYAVAISGAFVD